MNYLYGYDAEVAQFVAQLIPSCRERGFGRCKTIGVLDGEGMLIAGLVYHNYDPDARVIEISAAALTQAGKIWMTRETLKRMFQYPFLRSLRLPDGDPAHCRRRRAAQRQMAAFDATCWWRCRMLNARQRRRCWKSDLTYEAWAGNKFNRRFGHHVDQRVRGGSGMMNYGNQRNAIAQALMNVRNPQPRTQMPRRMPRPDAAANDARRCRAYSRKPNRPCQAVQG